MDYDKKEYFSNINLVVGAMTEFYLNYVQNDPISI